MSQSTPSTQPSGPLDQLRLAGWFGLAAGYLDVLATQGRRLFVEPIVFVGRHQLWTAPVADLALFTCIGFGFLIALRLIRHPAVRAVPVWTYLTLSMLGPLYLFPSIHRLAALLLAMGVGIQGARWASANEAAFRRLVRRTFPWLAGATTALMAGMVGWQTLAERRALSLLPPVRLDSPNVLLIVLDTVRAMNLSLYGYHRSTTPELLRRASSGVRFTRAFAPGPWTLPSHASMFTGRHVHELSADWMVPLDGTYPVLSEVLGRAGYRSGGFVANTDYCSEEVGLARGFTHYEDYTSTPGQIARSAALWRMIARVRVLRRLTGSSDNLGRKTAPMINARFLAWLERDPGRPFFAFLNFYDAHRPYLPPAPYDTMFRTSGIPLVPRIARESGEEPQDPKRVVGALDAYDNAIAALDASLGDLLRQLEARGALANTIVIITSDHGEEFLEHGAWDHGNTLYLPAVHVPLLILLPQQRAAGRTVTAPVSLTDIPATIAELVGLVDSPFPGGSLARHLLDSAPNNSDTLISAVRQVPRQSPRYPVSHGNMVSFVTGDLRFIWNQGTGRAELYRYVGDPLERDDLSKTSVGQADLPRLRAEAARLFSGSPPTSTGESP